MKQLITSVVLVAFFSLNAFAQETKTVTGYLVDKSCATGMVKKAPEEAMAKAASHKRSCALMPDCSATGYGVVSEGKYIKFDEKGDATAKDFLTKSKKKDHIYVEAVGTMNGDVFTLTSLKPAKMPSMKMEKKPAAKETKPM
jgi:hypothetical protein